MQSGEDEVTGNSEVGQSGKFSEEMPLSRVLNNVKQQSSPRAGGRGSKQRHRCKGPEAERTPSFSCKKAKGATGWTQEVGRNGWRVKLEKGQGPGLAGP